MFGDLLLPDLSSFVTTFCCTAPQLERLCPDHLSRPSLSRSFLLSSPLRFQHQPAPFNSTPVLPPLHTVLLLLWSQVLNLRIEDDYEPIPGFCALRPEIYTLTHPRRMNLVDFSYQVFQSAWASTKQRLQLESPSGAFTVK